MNPRRAFRCYELPAPIIIDGQTFTLFKPDGSPNGNELRDLLRKLKKMVISVAEEIFQKVIQAMHPGNAVRIYRNLCSVAQDTWMGARLSVRLHELGFVFAEVIHLRGQRRMIASIPGRREGETIIYVSPNGRRGELRHGERVIVPRFPRGQRVHKFSRHGAEAYLQVIWPARPWRRNHETLEK